MFLRQDVLAAQPLRGQPRVDPFFEHGMNLYAQRAHKILNGQQTDMTPLRSG
jgi:hypothetical protein